MFVNLNTETINAHCLLLLTFMWLFSRSPDRQSNLYVAHSACGQCSADKVTGIKILSKVCIVMTKKPDRVMDFL